MPSTLSRCGRYEALRWLFLVSVSVSISLISAWTAVLSGGHCHLLLTTAILLYCVLFPTLFDVVSTFLSIELRALAPPRFVPLQLSLLLLLTLLLLKKKPVSPPWHWRGLEHLCSPP